MYKLVNADVELLQNCKHLICVCLKFKLILVILSQPEKGQKRERTQSLPLPQNILVIHIIPQKYSLRYLKDNGKFTKI